MITVTRCRRKRKLPAHGDCLIIRPVARRLHIPRLVPGEIALDRVQAHHARSVLRLPDGMPIEVFDDEGNVAEGTLLWQGGEAAAVRIERVSPPPADAFEWTVASAVPKGERADWMVEKLSELGTAAFIPLATARGVVLPEGKNKRERWMRIATESAKQSRRRGIMRVGELTPLAMAVGAMEAGSVGWYLSPDADAVPVKEAAGSPVTGKLVVFVGPEGGWSEQELGQMRDAGLIGVRLTQTILRVETAAVAAAVIVGTLVLCARGA